MRSRYLLVGLTLVLLIVLGVALFIFTRPKPITYRVRFYENGIPQSLNPETMTSIILSNDPPMDVRKFEYPSPDKNWVARWTILKEWYWWKLELVSASGEIHPVGEFSACDSTASWSPDSKTLAFAFVVNPSDPSGVSDTVRCEIHLYDVENDTLTRLTDNNFFEGAPAFSPDGSKLVFSSAEDGFYRLYIMDVKNHDRRLLTRDSFGFRPAWSPDGRWIAFMSNHQEFNDDIYLIAPNGTGLRRLTISKSVDDYPSWVKAS